VVELEAPGPERDNGLQAIIDGRKTALTGLLEILDHAGDPVPHAGDRFTLLDSTGSPRSTSHSSRLR
jgi:dipeptidase E